MNTVQDAPLRAGSVPSLGASDGTASRPLLARDADATYWMSRYIERAEHVARQLQVNGEALIDVGDLDEALLDRHWLSIIEIMGSEPLPPGDQALGQRVAHYMTFDEPNVNSLIRCLTRARENARGIREVISTEMWEQLNLLYWYIHSEDTTASFSESPADLYQRIVTGSMLFQGLADQTLAHSERWHFVQLGRYFERIIVTCRILRTKCDIARDAEVEQDSSVGNIHWSAVLRSCGALEAYRRTHLGELDPEHVAQFLVFQADYPRSIRYGVRRSHQAIANIRATVRPRSVDPTERVLGRLDAQLEYAEADHLSEENLPGFLNQILEQIAEAAVSVQRSFFLH